MATNSQALVRLLYCCLLSAVASCYAIAAESINVKDASAPVFITQPSPIHIIATADRSYIHCSTQPQAQPVSTRWQFEEYTVNVQQQLKSSDKKAGVVPRTPVDEMPFHDSGNGSLILRSNIRAEELYIHSNHLPRFRLFCAATAVSPNTNFTTVSHWIVPLRVANLLTCQANINTVRAPLGGTFVFTVTTDPSLTKYFNVRYFRQDSSMEEEEEVRFDPHKPKHAIFNGEESELHLLNMTSKDDGVKYSAQIELMQDGEVIYSHRTQKVTVKRLNTPSKKACKLKKVSLTRRFEQGMSLLLPCLCNSGSNYTWQHLGKDMSQLPHITEAGAIGSKFALLSPSAGDMRIIIDGPDDAGNYSCFCDGEHVSDIDLHLYKPLSVKVQVLQQSISLGGNVTLQCNTSGWPTAEAQWLHNGRPIGGQEAAEKLRHEGGGQLVIENFQLSDQGSYQCALHRQMETDIIPFDSVQDSVQVRINSMPPVLVRQQPSTEIKIANMDGAMPIEGNFTCLFLAPDSNVTVLVDDRPLGMVGGSFTKIVQGRSVMVTVRYTISRVNQSGSYEVLISNVIGNAICRLKLLAVGKSVSLTVRDFMQEEYMAVKGKRLQLPCRIIGGVNSALKSQLESQLSGLKKNFYTTKWRHLSNGAWNTVPRTHTVKAFQENDTLLVTGASEDDIGTYECKADVGNCEDCPVAKTKLNVVNGISIAALNDAVDNDKEMNIIGTCNPSNTPEGRWFAWWEFATSPDEQPRYLNHSTKRGSAKCSSDSSITLDSECALPTVPKPVLSYPCHTVELDIRPPLNVEYAGVFVCRIVSCLDSGSVSKRVTFKPDYQFEADSPPNNKLVILGKSLSVDCKLKPIREESMPNLIWYIGKSIDESKRVPMKNSSRSQRIYQLQNGTLHITTIQSEDRQFLCRTDINRADLMKSVVFHANIKRPALVHEFNVKSLYLELGSSKRVSCNVSGDPKISISWTGKYAANSKAECKLLQPNQQLDLQYQHQQVCSSGSIHADYYGAASIHVNGSVIEFENVNPGIAGVFSCSASNQYNSQNPSTKHFNVVVLLAPEAVSSLLVSDSGHDRATVQWEHASNFESSGIQKYVANVTGPGDPRGCTDIEATAKSCEITNLLSGQTYTFTIRAINTIGKGPMRYLTIETRQRAPNGTVLQLKAVAVASAALTVSWKPPPLHQQNGHPLSFKVELSPLTKSGPECNPSSNFDVSLICKASPAKLVVQPDPDGNCRVEGNHPNIPIMASTPYQIRVRALNSIGLGPPACTNVTTPKSAPESAPRSVNCTAIDSRSIRVTWQPPDSSSVNGDIKNYFIQYLPMRDFLLQDESNAVESSLAVTQQHQHEITNLLPYTQYAIRLSVSNDKGRSAPSQPATCWTKEARPLPPHKAKVLAVNSSALVVAWAPHDRDKGIVQSYSVRYLCNDCSSSSSLGQEQQHDLPVTQPAARQFQLVLSGLQEGRQYSISIAAKSAGGISEFAELGGYVAVEPKTATVVPFSEKLLVPTGTKITLYCSVVGPSGVKPVLTSSNPDEPNLKLKEDGTAEVVLQGASGVHKKTYNCGCSTACSEGPVAFDIDLFDPKTTQPRPKQPKLLSGKQTLSSVEIRWQPQGISAKPEVVFAVGSRAFITHYKLEMLHLTKGTSVTQRLPGTARSHVLGPIACGSEVEFKIRAGNGFDMKSEYSSPFRVKALGSAPSLLPGGSFSARRVGAMAEFDFSDVTPGAGCPPAKFLLRPLPAAAAGGGGGSAVTVLPRQLRNGKFNLSSSISSSGRFNVTAANAAGSLQRVVLLAEPLTRSRTRPAEARPNDALNSWPFLLAAGAVLLLVACISVVFAAVFCHHRKQPVYRTTYTAGRGHQHPATCAEKAARAHALMSASIKGAQPGHYDDDDRDSVDSQGNLKPYATFDTEGTAKKARPGAVPYENDSTIGTARVRAASVSNIAGGGHYATGHQQLPYAPPVLPPGYPLSPAERTGARVARDYHRFPGATQQAGRLGPRQSHMSSATTLSSNHDELDYAYKRQAAVAAAAALPHTADYEDTSGNSEFTDPGIRCFTNRPPNPNELRNATCEVPCDNQQLGMRQRLQKQLSADSEQTYESIDEMQRSMTLRRQGTLPLPPSSSTYRRAGSLKLRQVARHNAGGGELDCSATTGEYEPADSLYNYGTQSRYKPAASCTGTYASYRPGSNRNHWLQQQQQQQQIRNPRLDATREDEEEVQQLLTRPAAAAAAASAADPGAAALDDSDGEDEDDPIYTEHFTVV